jgi:hypothetical protein
VIQEWPYFDYIRSLFESVGLDHFINGSFNKGTFYTFFGEFTRRKELDKLRCASDDESHMEQPCAIHGRITEVHKAFPNSTLLSSPCFPRILTIPFS